MRQYHFFLTFSFSFSCRNKFRAVSLVAVYLNGRGSLNPTAENQSCKKILETQNSTSFVFSLRAMCSKYIDKAIFENIDSEDSFENIGISINIDKAILEISISISMRTVLKIWIWEFCKISS